MPSSKHNPFATKKTELDKLKARLNTQAGRLKNKLENRRKYIQNEKYAKEYTEEMYDSLLECCDDILADQGLDDETLVVLKLPFADIFHPEDVLLKYLDQSSMAVHRRHIASITKLLADVAEVTETILAKLNSSTQEDDEREREIAQKHTNNPAPSQAAKPINLQIHQTKKDSQTIYDGRPADKTGPLLSVYHSIFADFEQECDAPPDVSPDDICAARGLMEASADHYRDEGERGTAIKGALHYFLGADSKLDPIEVKGMNRNCWKPDGLVQPICGLFKPADSSRIWFPSLIFELKNDLGGATSNPLIQACFDYDLFCTYPKMKRLRRASCDLSCMPVFILGIIGPYLSIGGAIHLDNHAVFQHLIPYHSLIPLPCVKKPEAVFVDNKDRAAADIAHILRVLKRCLDKLAADHLALHPKILEVPTNLLHPSPHFKTFRYEREEGQGHTLNEYKLIYRYHITGDVLSDRSVFRADACRDESTIPCVVKFAVRYGAKAHRIMEKDNAAVELLYCKWEHTVGRWVIITKYHEDLPLARQSQAGIDHLREALTNLHQQGYVHGDVRAPNIIVDKDDKPRFIDFDWSHEIGKACYPSNLNPDVEWPGGARGGGLIKAEHDLEMLNNYWEYIEGVGAKVTTS